MRVHTTKEVSTRRTLRIFCSGMGGISCLACWNSRTTMSANTKILNKEQRSVSAPNNRRELL